jgi:uncharacterized protein (UPF0332 family)
MPFDWNDFLTLAEELAARDDQASKRTAISRAYYSVFHAANARAERTTGRSASLGNSHWWCWSQYSTTNDNLARKIAANGERLKKIRTQADYKPEDIPKLGTVVERVLLDVQQFQTDLANLNPLFPTP